LPEAVGWRRAASALQTISVVHAFSGGVTQDWLAVRIRKWEALLQPPQAGRSDGGSFWLPSPSPARTIH
jgi:hypothetical protein